MSTFIMAMTLVITIILALASGIALGYLAARSILRAFGHQPQKPVSATLTAAGLQSSGD